MCTLNKTISTLTVKEEGQVDMVYFLLEGDRARDYENNYHLRVNLDEKEDFEDEIKSTDNQVVIN